MLLALLAISLNNYMMPDGTWIDIVKQLGVPTAVMTVVGWWTYKLVGFLKELIKIELLNRDFGKNGSYS